MSNKKTKVYLYVRVSTNMQVDGYSIEAQKERMFKYADAFDYEVVRTYQDAGKSGKSINGRDEFKSMLDDIESRRDDISYVLVYKLSRFGRNAADVLVSLQHMQDYNVNLICVEDGIDSSKDAGKLMISVLSSVAEIERENILVQTMEGRKQKAREGKWNGGLAPYGYKLDNGLLIINEDEASTIRLIFDKLANENMTPNGVATYLQEHDIKKLIREKTNRSSTPYFSKDMIIRIINNPIYCGKIAFGRRKTEKVAGQRGKTKIVKTDNFSVYDGVHEGIVSVETWERTLEMHKERVAKYNVRNIRRSFKVHILSGLLTCPECGSPMYTNKSIKHGKDGKKDYYYYVCKHRRKKEGHTCTYRRSISEVILHKQVSTIISSLISNAEISNKLNELISIKTNAHEVENEVELYKKQITKFLGNKRIIENQIDNLDIESKLFERKLHDLQNRLDSIYENIDTVEEKIENCKRVIANIKKEELTRDNIYKVLRNFNSLYSVMSDEEKRELLNLLIDKIEIFNEPKENGQWIKEISFNLPIVDGCSVLSLDNETHVESVVLMERMAK